MTEKEVLEDIVMVKDEEPAYWYKKGAYPGWMYCSNCNEPWSFNTGTPPYCPCCGKKMEKEEDITKYMIPPANRPWNERICKKILEVLEQEPKTGHWIRCDILQEFKCSKCRVCFMNKSNYCPNCGAKMIAPQESEGI